MPKFEKFESIDWGKFSSPMVSTGVSLMKQIEELGYEAYIVGGAVRDIAMGDSAVHDIDIATNMPIEVIKTHFITYQYGGGERHGTVIVHVAPYDYELTQFRTESGYSDKRRPDCVEFVQSFEEDTKRRDFTINSMGIDSKGSFIDYHGGLHDIKHGILKTVGDAKERFDEDALRILRAIRFASRFGFTIDALTLQAMIDLAHTVTSTSIERIRDELVKTISYGSDKFAYALEIMATCGLWDLIIPETPLTADKIKSIRALGTKSPTKVFAVLMQDMKGKKIEALCRRLTFTVDEMKMISFIVDSLQSYRELDSIDRQKALSIVTHSDFEALREVYIAIFSSDIKKSIEIISKISTFSAVQCRGKEINQIIQDEGLVGKQFGQMVHTVLQWLFDEHDRGITHSTADIELFVKEHKE
jgi:tRNA nucleotidyltransferase/poly(A) polymerase